MGNAIILALVLGASGAPQAPEAPQAPWKAPEWNFDVNTALFREAWDENEQIEWLAGVGAAVDRRVWRGLALRGELLALRVQQARVAWLRGFTVGTRARWHRSRVQPIADVAVGLSHSTAEVPVRGTRSNYLAVIGAGAETAVGQHRVSITGRWLHLSNNGREGRQRNPDIQSLGVVVGLGWR